MRKMVIVPIEPLEERYSKDWLQMIYTYGKKFGQNSYYYQVIHSDTWSYPKIETGAFLDTMGTTFYKSQQLLELVRYIQAGLISDNSTILFMDGWFPGVETLAYIRDLMNINFRLAGMFHAGTYDVNDFLYRKGIAYWAKPIERGWLNLYDKIYVATNYHKNLLIDQFDLYNDKNFNCAKIQIINFPLYTNKSRLVSGSIEESLKENIVVFPHRLDPEKRPFIFDTLKALAEDDPIFSAYEFIKTKEFCETKQAYYDLLRMSRFAISCSLQETWGIAMQEAVMANCIPVVPNDLSYVEMYPDFFQYRTADGFNEVVIAQSILEKMRELYEYRDKIKVPLLDLKERFRRKGAFGVKEIIEDIQHGSWEDLKRSN